MKYKKKKITYPTKTGRSFSERKAFRLEARVNKDAAVVERRRGANEI